jgi:DNA-binding CsgD family transcriptional regulator
MFDVQGDHVGKVRISAAADHPNFLGERSLYPAPVLPLARVERICADARDERALRVALLAEIGRRVPFDAYVWMLTDPWTCVGLAPLADIPSLAAVPTVVRWKYLTATNRWTELPAGTAVTLLGATGGDRSKSRLWAEVLAGYGIDDIASAVLRDQYGCWGFLDLWRRDGAFTTGECEWVAAVAQAATAALRRCLSLTFSLGWGNPPTAREPVLFVVADDLTMVSQTSGAEWALRALLPTDAERAPVPASIYNVAAQLLAREQGVDGHAASARAHLGSGRWVTLAAARMIQPTPGAGSIAVSIEPTPPGERTELYARALGLTEREREVLGLLVSGCDSRELARRLNLSEYTVQDHLKAMFAKADTRSRRVLVARATGAG